MQLKRQPRVPKLDLGASRRLTDVDFNLVLVLLRQAAGPDLGQQGCVRPSATPRALKTSAVTSQGLPLSQLSASWLRIRIDNAQNSEIKNRCQASGM